MSWPDGGDRFPGSGPSCEQLAFVSRLAVDDPSALAREPWVTHLHACAICRDEATQHVRALAVFRTVERERLTGEGSTLTWEEVIAGIEREDAGAANHGRVRVRWAIPAVAVATGALAVTLAIGLDGLQDGDGPVPARIVRVQPYDQRSMEQVVRWAIESEEPDSDPLRLRPEPVAARAAAPSGERTAMPAAEGRGLAASVSARMGDDAPVAEDRVEDTEPLKRAPLPAGSPFERWQAPPTFPASARLSRPQPLFRLEQRMVPIQSVSFASHD